MAIGATKMVLGLLTFVTVGMLIGALFQLAFIRHLEESSGFLPWERDEDARMLRIGFVKPEIISWSPRIIVFHNFLSPEECDYLIAIARPRLRVSTVVDTKTGKGIKSDVRTSSGMFLNHEEKKYPMIQAIEKRISVYSQVPAENGELMQILRYEKGEFYKPHHDYFSDEFNIKRGQRIATMLMYLSDDLQGGETNFPLAGDMECSCGGKMVKGVCVKPKKGDAILFWSMGLDGSVDPKSIHGGCEVSGGVKWSATKWMRERIA
ncbi:prolyl 4-hydroxylase 1 isoform X2 [Cryptomeria japonica]|uniref:prolyl 4-hydroxylase 1 isoform X2 n=1 Tax=Cryptomeria japonica TaxID=3369 RepID=UPI0025AD02C8|nr:prolyl 4-hydroxylase 1 isoform X2 [Cryptomeria japonica]